MRALIALDSDERSDMIVDAVAPWLRQGQDTALLLRVMDEQAVQRTVPRAEGHLPVAPDDERGMAIGLDEPRTDSIEDRTQAIDRVEAAAREQLNRLAATSLSGVAHEIHLALASDAAGAILKQAEELRADAIALGTHGRGGLRPSLLGSVAEAVVRASPVPVFLVGQGVRMAEADPVEQAQAEARGRRVAEHREEEVDPLALNVLIESQRDDP